MLYVDQVTAHEHEAQGDDGEWHHRWSHLLADTEPELHAAARELDRRGVAELLARRRAQHAQLSPPVVVFLDWRDRSHYGHSGDRPCVLCGRPTPLRSHHGEAAHKTCAEEWAAAHRDGRFISDADVPARRPAARPRSNRGN